MEAKKKAPGSVATAHEAAKEAAAIAETVAQVSKNAAEAAQDHAAKTPHVSKSWTIDDMKTIGVKDLKKVCEELGIDYAAITGINNNKKLRQLIFNFHNEPGKNLTGQSAPQGGEPKGGAGDNTVQLPELIKAIKGKVVKVQDKAALKVKMGELGAQNLSSMTIDQAITFNEYLDSL